MFLCFDHHYPCTFSQNQPISHLIIGTGFLSMALICGEKTQVRKPAEQELTQLIYAPCKDEVSAPPSELITGKEKGSFSSAEGLDQSRIDPLNS